jgi:hypothetical protein
LTNKAGSCKKTIKTQKTRKIIKTIKIKKGHKPKDFSQKKISLKIEKTNSNEKKAIPFFFVRLFIENFCSNNSS